MRYRQLMPAPGTTNLVVTDTAGDALRQRARELSAELGRRVSLSEALTMSLAQAEAETTRERIAQATR